MSIRPYDAIGGCCLFLLLLLVAQQFFIFYFYDGVFFVFLKDSSGFLFLAANHVVLVIPYFRILLVFR
jgi:hypothetical protein